MNKIVNGSNFSKKSDFIFSEIISSEEFNNLKKINPHLQIIRHYKYLKIDAIWYVNPIIELKNNDVIFSHTELVELLFKAMEKFSNVQNIKLITHQSDKFINKKLFEKKPENISEWYSTNVSYANEKLIPIPLGVNNFYNKNNFDETNQKVFQKNINSSNEKKSQIFVNFTLDTNFRHRKTALKHVNLLEDKNINVDFGKNTQQYFENVAQSKYTLAPWGNGVDTYRFWEALYLGSCPITLSHTHYLGFKGLPAILINSYSDLNMETLEEKYIKFNPKEINYLNMDYWFDKITHNKSTHSVAYKKNLTPLINKKITLIKLKIKFESKKKIVVYYLKRYTNPNNYVNFFKKIIK